MLKICFSVSISSLCFPFSIRSLCFSFSLRCFNFLFYSHKLFCTPIILVGSPIHDWWHCTDDQGSALELLDYALEEVYDRGEQFIDASHSLCNTHKTDWGPLAWSVCSHKLDYAHGLMICSFPGKVYTASAIYCTAAFNVDGKKFFIDKSLVVMFRGLHQHHSTETIID